ncbi:NAD(P)-binding protein [candidate division GN15 bacterium]|nr:NAD(P)-binding protein [candidate division GN15 bacterium]
MTSGKPSYDAVVVGAGPNGLAAAAYMARAGFSVVVLEAAATPGGGARSAELTLPGVTHDICSAVHPLTVGSPFLQKLALESYGLRWIYPDVTAAHPLDGGDAAALYGTVPQTAELLGSDSGAYKRLIEPLAVAWEKLSHDLLAPPRIPKHPLLMARFARHGLQSARRLCDRNFQSAHARALFAGMAAHSMLPLEQAPSAAVGLVLTLAGHAVGWPIPQGGAQSITTALTAYVKDHDATILTDMPVNRLSDLPRARVALFDITPRQLLTIAGDALPSRYRRRLEAFRYGPGVFKIDWALDRPIPWTSDWCRRAGTVHVGGTFDEIAASEAAVTRGKHPEEPFVLVAQPTVQDPSRAPAGSHIGWAYCHVPNGSTVDMTEAIERQVERFAPGFRDTILARHTLNTAGLEAYNANYVGGDINGGIQDFRQLLARPVLQWNPYATGQPGVYLCSSSTPPGGGVHGMCGYHAARAALADCLS